MAGHDTVSGPMNLPVSPNQLLQSIIKVTDHHDSQKFRQSLADTICELVPVGELLFIRPIRSSSEPVYELLDAATFSRRLDGHASLKSEDIQSILTEQNLAEMTSQGSHIVEHRGASLLLLPVAYRNTLLEIVVVVGEAFSHEAMTLMLGFVRLYRNFLALINESEKDPLTGLFNRKTLEVRLKGVVHESNEAHRQRDAERRRNKTAEVETELHSYLAIFDIDHFKRINDTYGHLFGDEVIILVARLMKEVFRREDALFRYGGEEFIVVLTAINDNDAMIAVERFRETIANYRFPQIPQVTVSIGFTEILPSDVTSSVVGRADQALYHAKSSGRNQSVNYTSLIPEGGTPQQQVTGEIDLF